MDDARLILFGPPMLSIGGELHQVFPRKAFQLLVLLALAPEQSLQRACICESLWPNTGRSAQLQRLRPCLVRLKGELKRLSLDLAVVANPHTIGLSGELKCDVTELLERGSETDQRLQPLMVGWEEDFAPEIRRSVEEAFAGNLRRRWGQDNAEKLRAQAEQFLSIYPSNVAITAHLYALLQAGSEAAAASDLIMQFEAAWLDKHGFTDLPNIAEIASSLPSTSGNKVTRRKFLSMGISTFAASALVYSFWRFQRDGPLPLEVNQRFRVNGLEIEALELYRSRTDTLRDCRLAFDGTVLGGISDGAFRASTILWNEGSDPVVREQPEGFLTFADKQGSAELTEQWDKDHKIGILLHEGRQVIIEGDLNDEHRTDVLPTWFLDSDSFLVQKMCQHSAFCHRRTFVCNMDGQLKPLMELPEQPQVDVTIFRRNSDVFGVYTHGESTGWSNHTFRVREAICNTISEGFPVGVFGEKLLVHKKESDRLITANWVSLDTNDVANHWPGPAAESMTAWGPFILTKARESNSPPRYRAFTEQGTAIAALDEVLAGVSVLITSFDQSAICTRKKVGRLVTWTMYRLSLTARSDAPFSTNS